jgi:hypothetical protein
MAVGFPTKVDYATGDVLSAGNMNDLSGTVNLLESAQYAAGKNKIINGDFGINQRAFTSVTTNGTYTFDRWALSVGSAGGTATFTPQTFTLGAAPVAGYEGKNFAQIVSASQSAAGDYAGTYQRIEGVRSFAGQTVTISFYAKASAGTPNINVTAEQFFGMGGSATVVTSSTVQTITTSWVRYSFNIAIPSISGKTIGTGNEYLGFYFFTSTGTTLTALGYGTGVGLQNATFGFWGVQIEAASSASPFQTATGTVQGELAACQRYYFRYKADLSFRFLGTGQCFGTTTGATAFKYPVTMRTRPTALEQSGTASNYAVLNSTGSATACSAVPTYDGATTNEFGWVGFTVASGLTAGNATAMLSNNTPLAYLGWSAEL